MTIEELMEQWKADSVIDELELETEGLKTGKLHAKYMAILIENSLKAKKLQMDYKQRKEWWRRYYSGELNGTEELKALGMEPCKFIEINSLIERRLDTHKELCDLLLRKDYYTEMVNFCEGVLKELNNRTYAIGNSIKLKIFLGGG
jgi:Recombination, repair and ssDNA binding protein UvsY